MNQNAIEIFFLFIIYKICTFYAIIQKYTIHCHYYSNMQNMQTYKLSIRIYTLPNVDICNQNYSKLIVEKNAFAYKSDKLLMLSNITKNNILLMST
jgi:hypothetical protein